MRAAVAAPLLSLAHVTLARGGSVLLTDAHLSLSPGDFVHLRGANGCGKSTLLEGIIGMPNRFQGDIRLAGRDIQGDHLARRVGLGIGLVRQHNNTFGNLSALDTMQLCYRGPRRSFSVRLEWITEHLPTLSPHLRRPAGLLSGGLRRLAALAIVMINPRLLLMLDEPLGGLTEDATTMVVEALRSFGASRECATLLVEHNPAVRSLPITRTLIIAEGQLLIQS